MTLCKIFLSEEPTFSNEETVIPEDGIILKGIIILAWSD